MQNAKELGYKVGDKFVSNSNCRLGEGKIFVFDEDDDSNCPYFRQIVGGAPTGTLGCLSWTGLDLLEKVEEQSEPVSSILDLLDKLNDVSLIIDTSTSFKVSVRQQDEYVCDTQDEVVTVLNALLTLQKFA